MQRLFDRYPRWLAVLAGGASAMGFAPLNLWPLTLLCFALLMHLIARAESAKRAFLLGWLFGVAHFSIGNNWIATAFTFQSAMPVWLGWFAVVLLALYLAVYPALACWGTWWIAKRVDTASRTTLLAMAFAGCWIVTEWLRGWMFTGFPWNPLSAVWLDTLFANIALPTLGTYGFSGIVILAAAVSKPAAVWLSHSWHDSRFGRSGSWVAIVFVTIFILPVFIASLFPQRFLPLKPADTPQRSIEITVVQPNISQIDKYRPGYEAINFTRLARHSRPKHNAPRLLLWPEAAIPWWLEEGYPSSVYWDQPGGTAAGTRAALARLLGPNDVLLTGADRLRFGTDGSVAGAHNSVFAIGAGGEIGATYNKAHLVPYGEYLALRWLLEPLGAARLVPGDIDFWPGPGPRTMTVQLGSNRVKVGLQICYEIIFSGEVVGRGDRPDFIFNPSNDAWFGGWGSPQFLAQSRLRAIEEGLPVVRATPTGISAIVDANGQVLKTLGRGKEGRIDATLPAAKTPTLFSRHGNVLPLGFAALLVGLAFMPLASGRASR
jgi:apolipoprotein N-acyltransferase